MQHIIPTKVPYIITELYYTLWLVQAYYKAKRKPLQGWILTALTMACVFSFYASSFSNRFFMLLVLIHRVDVLCNRAEVVGGIMPATPRTINPVLMPTIMR